MSVKVLPIDDDQDFRVPVRSLLETRGYEALEAGSGHEGSRQVLENKPGVTLLDVMMETSVEGYGYGVTHALKYREDYAEHSHVPTWPAAASWTISRERTAACQTKPSSPRSGLP